MNDFILPIKKGDFIHLLSERLQKQRRRLAWQRVSFAIYGGFLALFVAIGAYFAARQFPLIWLGVLLGAVIAIVQLMTATRKKWVRSHQFCHFYRRKLAELGR